MDRWLLNHLSTAELTLVIVGGFTLLTIAAFVLVYRALPTLRQGESNDVAGVILGVLAAIYGIVLAFVIVSLYEDLRSAEANVRSEATTLSQIYRDSFAFSPEEHAKVAGAVGTYIHDVTGTEWKLMTRGEESDKAWADLRHITETLQLYNPQTTSQNVFYGEAVSKVNDLVSARRERLTNAEESLPITFQVLLVGGALMLVGFTFFFGVKNFRLHVLMVASVAALTSFNLLLALVLDHPFSGDVAVSQAPFHQGALADFHVKP